MRAKFIGENGSLGLKTGKVYTIIAQDDIILHKGWAILLVIYAEKIQTCPYSSLETLIDNWEFSIKEGDNMNV